MLTSLIIQVAVCLCLHSTILGGENKSFALPSKNAFHDAEFWQHFEKKVQERAWSCNFSKDVLQTTLEKDATLYHDPTLFKKRRSGVQQWTVNSTLWIATALGAARELRDGEKGEYVRELEDLKILDAFADYIDHLHFFQLVSDKMASLGQKVKPLSQDSSGIHDIDKLDPVMLVGYSEKFEDMANTSIWNLCVDRHTRVNPHHQAHCMWHGCCDDKNNCTFCEEVKTRALREMICDKVSRKVQKNLGGKLSKEMWDVDIAFFSGLPDNWLERAKRMMLELKGNDTYT